MDSCWLRGKMSFRIYWPKITRSKSIGICLVRVIGTIAGGASRPFSPTEEWEGPSLMGHGEFLG